MNASGPYRDDLEALRSRAADLASELEAVRARAVELGALRAREDELQRALVALQERIAAGSAPKRGLPQLDGLRVASPCSAKWEDMLGDDRVRHCLACDKQVFDVSAMTTAEAEAFLSGRAADGTKPCVRFYRRADGTVMTSDCPVGARKKRVRLAVFSGLGAGVLATAAFAAFAASRPRMGAVHVAGEMAVVPTETETPPAKDVPQGRMVMGDVAGDDVELGRPPAGR